MLDIGWQEIFIIGGLALIVVGPKDLPRALRTAMLGIRKIRGLAKDFQNGVDEMVREANLDDFKKEMEKIKQDEIERDLKYGVTDNTLGFDEVKRDLNKIAEGNTAKTGSKTSATSQSNASGGSADGKPASEPTPAKSAATEPAAEPVKRKKRGGAKPAPKAPPAAAKNKSTAKKPASAKAAKAPAKKAATKKTAARKKAPANKTGART